MGNPAREGGPGAGSNKASRGSLKFRPNSSSGQAVSWRGADANKILRTIAAATEAGAAIMLGKTQDGGAFSVIVLDGDSRMKDYSHNIQDLHDVLDQVYDHYTPNP